MKLQPWRSVAVENRYALRQLGALSRTAPYIAQVSLAIVVAIERAIRVVYDASRAAQSSMLTAFLNEPRATVLIGNYLQF